MADIDIIINDEAGSRGKVLDFTGSLTGTDDYFFYNDGKTRLLVKKGTGADTTMTVTSTFTKDGQALEDPAEPIAANEEKWFGPYDPSVYNDANGKVKVEFMGTLTNVEVAAVRVRQSGCAIIAT